MARPSNLTRYYRYRIEVSSDDVTYTTVVDRTNNTQKGTIMDQVTESAVTHGLMTRAEAERKAVELFRSLALPDPQHIGSRYPHQVSGGQLQRVMAAMALITGG